MAPRVVAVVCAYWPSRFGNIEQIVKDLQDGTVVPDKILVLNNNKDHQLEFEGAEVINSQFNSRCRGKFITALMDVADYYLLLDDDTSVGTRTLERFLEEAHRECCYGYYGIAYETGNGVRTKPTEIDEETECQYFLGPGLFMSFYALTRMLIAEERVRRETKWKHEGDDVLIGLTNKSSIIPMRGDELFVDLDWGEQAMAWGDDGVSEGWQDYLKVRDEFTVDAMKILSEHPIPEF